jgi:hypothetical protein
MWQSVLELNSQRDIVAGSNAALSNAIRRGADLRIYTEFIHNEHIDVHSDNNELVREVSEFPVTYLLEDRWVAAIMSRRQPISPPDSFGPRPSMSFFLYNQDGQQAIARPYLDGEVTTGSAHEVPAEMSKYHLQQNWDESTNAPSQNFIYDFELYRFYVNNGWREVFANDAQGNPQSGSLEELEAAFANGCEVKVAVRGLCSDLGSELEHELFVQLNACYYNTGQRLFSAGTHPVVRVAPQIPMLYASHNWDFGWLLVRCDGYVEYRCCAPYTLKFQDFKKRHALRWFVR